MAHEAHLLYQYYTSFVGDFYTEEPGFQYQIYHEALDAFNAVKTSGEKSITEMTLHIMELESELESNGIAKVESISKQKNKSTINAMDKIRILAYKINNSKLENAFFNNSL